MQTTHLWQQLLTLVGEWRGVGVGYFPTMANFRYRETLRIGGGHDDPILLYTQRAWRLTDDGTEVDSHWETGFLGLRDDGLVEFGNAQGVDRVEMLRGGLHVAGGRLVLDLRSVVLAGDDRMIRSWRTITVDADELSYAMGMATTAVPEGDMHLAASLKRIVAE